MKVEDRLRLQWARFFALAGLDWKVSYKPDFDFEVSFPCGHSECSGKHTILVRVLHDTYDALREMYSDLFGVNNDEWEDPALFGDGPSATYWEMAHGAGGGEESVTRWVEDAEDLWPRTVPDGRHWNLQREAALSVD